MSTIYLKVSGDAPTIAFGLKIEYMDKDEAPLFYLILNFHDMIVHNAMLDLGSSHNLMSKGVV